MNVTRAGIVAFVTTVVLAPLYAEQTYDWHRHLISELAAQGAPHRWLMSAAFVTLGAAIIIDGLRMPRVAWFPVIGFGLCFGLAGLFPHRPLDPTLPYNPVPHGIHGALAALSGTALTLALAWQAKLARRRWSRLALLVLALLCVAAPLAMLAFPQVRGVFQRTMYVLVFAWLWMCYPGRLRSEENEVAAIICPGTPGSTR